MQLSTRRWGLCWVAATALFQTCLAIDIDWTSDSSIKDGAATMAFDLMKYYTGNTSGDVPGNLPDPYYWWQAGAFFGLFVDYWAFTGDTTYVDETFQAMQHQVGDDYDFMPSNQTLSEGNDDQGFWAMASMSAAELSFKDPSNSSDAQWLAMTQAVFNEYVWRWDNTTCSGGIRWQIFTFNNGYNYKNSVSNGCFFDVAARLARYTGNTTYADWADTLWTWISDVGFLDADYNLYDGASDTDGNCSDIDKSQWTYNAGLWLEGAAYMYNYTNGSAEWGDRVNGLLNRTSEVMFNNSIMYEPPCEPESSCTTDEFAFKGILARNMARVTQMMASTYDTVYPLMLASAKAAAAQCTGTTTASHSYEIEGTACGMHWTETTYDGSTGVGQDMSALAVVLATIVQSAPAPYTADDGGTSAGDSSGGSDKTDSSVDGDSTDITTGDRAGAAIITTLVLGSLLGGCWFLVSDVIW